MPYPLANQTILDTFTGAGTALAAPWATAAGIFAGLATQDGAGRANGAANAAAYWSSRQFGPDVEVQMDIAVLPTAYLALFLAEQAPTNASTDTGYEAQYNGASQTPANTCQVFKHTGSATFTQLGANMGGAFAAGDKLAFQKVGTLLLVWRFTASAWSLVGSVNDTTTPKAGYVAFQVGDTTVRGDNFAAATIPTRRKGGPTQRNALDRASVWAREWSRGRAGVWLPRPSAWWDGWKPAPHGVLVPANVLA